jgi:transposase-like protein
MLAQLVLPLAHLIRGDVRELVLSFGLQALAAMLERERTELCGPRYKHDGARRATRAGSAPGELVLGGRRVRVKRPRVVDAETRREVALPSWSLLSNDDPLTKRAVEQMVVGVATRKYARSLEPLPEGVAERGTSKSAVSRRFVEETAERLRAWMARPLGELAPCAVMIDGLHVGEHVVLCALGIDEKGTKHVLGLWEGATENAVACRALLEDLVGRGLRADRAMLFVLDGAKALARAVRDVFGRRALIQRCQVHKMRNVAEHLPKAMQQGVRRTMRQAYGSTNVETAERQLHALARRLEARHPGAAASLREGLDETLTVIGLRLPRLLERSLATTNPIESLNSRIRAISGRVKQWQGGSMALRWAGAAVVEAERGFRRLKGSDHMPKLLAALRAHEQSLSANKVVAIREQAA